jgi:L-2-hydroxyglutarate oxidase LhgO
MSIRTTDFAIIGGGVIGLTLAWELRQRFPQASITVFEKEPALARHSSGRNSGVLHAGLYYPEGSLKARVCTEGARLLADYCRTRRLPFKPVGKIILPVREDDDSQLELLQRRARANGVRVETLDIAQLRTLEPEAHSITGQALFSPETSVFDPIAVMERLALELRQQDVSIRLGEGVWDLHPPQTRLTTGSGAWHYGRLLNTAGLHADRVARVFDLGRHYRILPFKGLYYNLSPSSSLRINRHIYPVPDLRLPFLGVHFTVGASGRVYLGPTAVPALGREHYGRLSGLDWMETPAILGQVLRQYWRNRNAFRHFTHQEAFRFFKSRFVQAAQRLVPRLQSRDLVRSDKVGIRAQLLNLETGNLEQDFVIIPAGNSVHILNAVSPAFTSSFAFARLVCDSHFR